MRLAEAGKADAKHDQQQAEKEERTIARLRMDLRRRESDVQMLQADLRNAHDALAQAVKVGWTVLTSDA